MLTQSRAQWPCGLMQLGGHEFKSHRHLGLSQSQLLPFVWIFTIFEWVFLHYTQYFLSKIKYQLRNLIHTLHVQHSIPIVRYIEILQYFTLINIQKASINFVKKNSIWHWSFSNYSPNQVPLILALQKEANYLFKGGNPRMHFYWKRNQDFLVLSVNNIYKYMEDRKRTPWFCGLMSHVGIWRFRSCCGEVPLIFLYFFCLISLVWAGSHQFQGEDWKRVAMESRGKEREEMESGSLIWSINLKWPHLTACIGKKISWYIKQYCVI